MSLILRSLLWLALVSSGMRLEASAQAPDSTPDLDGEWPWPAAVFVLEATAFGTAALTRSATGARVIGSIQGMSGLAVLSVAGFSDRETGYPEFMVPYGVGLVGLAYYNFRHADSPRRKQRFWINAIGLNVAVLAGILSSEIFAARKQGSSGMRPGPTGFVVSIPF
jgi:hypothetical protein